MRFRQYSFPVTWRGTYKNGVLVCVTRCARARFLSTTILSCLALICLDSMTKIIKTELGLVIAKPILGSCILLFIACSESSDICWEAG